ncbi:MAG: lipid A export permease/ATP-binding protein MsbA [Gammaproteobacteria bacterium]|nr:lipid A export permease/ATP-binding protein MsbA [Gammaproteobacteria bacterium]MDJ0893320.1 lipid A export permease/ATP-binding protein MsbA [Gammaproteobacteria bacterium]
MTSKELYLRLLRFVLPHRRVFALSILGTALLAATEPVLPALLKPLLDGSFVERDPTVVTLIPLVLIGLFILRGLAGYVGGVAMRWVANRVVMDLRTAMFARVLELPTHYFDQQSSGQIISRLTYDVSRVMQACTDVLVVLVRDSVIVIGLLGWMFYLNWQLSLVTVVVAPPTAWVIRTISRRLRRLSRSLQRSMGELTDVIQEAVVGHKVVKIFGAQGCEAARFEKVNSWIHRYHMKVATASEANTPVVQFLVVLALSVVIYAGTLQSQSGDMTVGGFVSLFTAMALLFTPIRRLTRINEKLQMGLAAAESVFALVDHEPEPRQAPCSLGRARGELSFDRVWFTYPTGREVLRGIELRVRAGETVALVGPSGSGKSTLVNLIAGFYGPSAGRITLDGTDIQELVLADLRRNIAYVGQETVLFNDTVAANIAYGQARDADRAAVEQAARAAHVMEFVEALPQGLDTLIGENGVRLSGGQRQRIAIARALMKDAPVLILDEATSALDSESERLVQEALESLRSGRTSLIVAHRLSTVEHADRIIVMEGGRIVEAGDHRSLLRLNKDYARLCRLSDERCLGVS